MKELCYYNSLFFSNYFPAHGGENDEPFLDCYTEIESVVFRVPYFFENAEVYGGKNKITKRQYNHR